MKNAINPWWFYIMEVCGDMKVICFLGGAAAFLVGAGVWAYLFGDTLDNWSNEIKFAKMLIIIGLIAMVVSIIVPSQEVLAKLWRI